MREISLTLPEIGLIAGTRAFGGAGIGFLLANRLNSDERRAVGWALLGVAALTTVPIVALVLSKRQGGHRHDGMSARFSRLAQASSR